MVQFRPSNYTFLLAVGPAVFFVLVPTSFLPRVIFFFLNKGYTGFIHAKFPRDHGQFSTEAIFDNLKWHYLCIAVKERELGDLLLEMEERDEIV